MLFCIRPKTRSTSKYIYNILYVALLDVPNSIEHLLKRLHKEGYDLGEFATDSDASGQSLVAALSIICEDSVIAGGVDRMPKAIEDRMRRARDGDHTVPETLGLPGGGLGGAKVVSCSIVLKMDLQVNAHLNIYLPLTILQVGKEMNSDDLERMLGKYMMTKVRNAWSESERGPGINGKGEMVACGLQLGNIFITVQPLLGVEGDPMRLLFERDLTPHPQYCACYKYMQTPQAKGGLGAQAVIHLGMHGTVEWLPGQPLG